jgi:hypothetical protein
MRNPRPFVVIQNGTVLFTPTARGRLADTTGVRIVAQGSLR